MLDISRSDPFQQLETLKNEIIQYKKDFLQGREHFVVLNKIDLIEDSNKMVKGIAAFLGTKCFGVSAKYGDGV